MMSDVIAGVKAKPYCDAVSQEDWPGRVARVIATEVRRYRNERGLTAEQLSERCAQLGAEIPRAVLANLENGRRSTVTVAELLVLARALGVEPMRLIVPLGSVEEVEISPGQWIPSWDAARWISGVAHLEGAPGGGVEVVPAADWAVVIQFFVHDQLVEDWRDISPNEGVMDSAGNVSKTSSDLRRDALRALRRHRSHMRKDGLIPPLLPPDLAHLDHEDGGRDDRE